MLSLFTLLVTITVSREVHSSRILGLFPHVGKSHQMVFDPLLRELAERGHHVTVVTFFPVNNTPANYTSISLEGQAETCFNSLDLSGYEQPNKVLKTLGLDKIVKQIYEFQPLADLALDVCSKLVKFVPLAKALQKEYDVVLVEGFNSDCMLGLVHVYGVKAPVVSLLSTTLMQWSADRIGVSDNPSHVPIISGYKTQKLTFWQRFKNTALSLYYKIWFRYAIQLKEAELIENHFGRKIPDLQDLGKNITMMLVNVFHSLNADACRRGGRGDALGSH